MRTGIFPASMRRLQFLIPIVGAAAVSLFGLASCGDNSVACGDGTHAENGLCVPDATCGPGTKEGSDGKCVPDGSLICPQGTTFVDGQCKLDDNACGEGTVLVDGECILEDDNLTADLDEAAEPNDDPAMPAGMITVGAIDSSTVIHGCVDPRNDDDGDGNPDADFDLWMVNVSGPTTLEITADGVHGLVAGFVMINADPLLQQTLSNWRRFGINLTSDTAKREVYLPAAGSYAMLMTDARSLVLGSVGAGSPEACYYTTVKRVANPTPVALTIPQTATTDAGKVKAYSFNPATAGRILDVSINTASSAMFPAFLVLRQNNLYASVRDTGGFYTVGGLNMGETVTLISDMEYNWAIEPVDYTYDLFDIVGQPLPADGMVTLTKRNGTNPFAPYADWNYLYFDVAAAGDIINFNVTATNTATPPVALPLDMVIYRRDIFTPAGAGDTVTVIDSIGGTGRTGGFANQFVRFLQPGRYYFVVQDPVGTSGQQYVVTSKWAVTPKPAVALGTPVPATALPANNNAFHTLDLTNPIWVQFGVSGTNFPTGTATARLSVYDLAGGGWLGGTGASGNLAATFTSTQNADGTTPVGRVLARDNRDWLLRVEPVGTPAANPTYSLDVKNRDFQNFMTIMSGTPITSNGMNDIPAATSATVFGTKRFFVFGTTGHSLTIAATPTNALADIQIRRVDAAEATVTTTNTGLVGVAETMINQVFGPTNPAPPAIGTDWVAFEIQNRTLAQTTNVNITLTSAPPPYAVGNGAIAWSDACAGGMQLGTNLDDEIQAARPLGFNFPLFGAANTMTHYRVGANGWIHLGDAAVTQTCSFGCYSNETIPNTSASTGMNNLVVPFWDDLDGTTLCVKEEATKVTVQWVGNEYVNGTTLGAKVAFQAIINMNGTVNFVYDVAANHVSTGANGVTIGVENANGTQGVTVANNGTATLAGMARTFTPQ